MAACPSCGSEVPSDARFCASCGAAIGPPSPPVQPSSTTDRRQSRADSKADRARDKALRPWYRKKRFLLPIGLVVLVIIIAVAASGGPNKSSGRSGESEGSGTSGSASGCASAPGPYPDQQKKDCIAGPEGQLELFGVSVTASNPHRISGELGTPPGICADVNLVNRSSKSQDYNEFFFKLQTPLGDVRSFDVVFGQQNGLGSGVIVAGGTKSGTVCFEDKGEKGRFILIYKPNAFDATRGLWFFNLT